MRSFFTFIFVVCFGIILKAQNAPVYKITYVSSYNGKSNTGSDPTVVLANSSFSVISSEKGLSGKAKVPFEKTIIDQQKHILYKIAVLKGGGQALLADSNFIKRQKLNEISETKKILGYTCKKAETVINSNKIEIWYTQDLKGIHAGPSELGQQLGLVLQVIRNGNFVMEAKSVEKLKSLKEQPFVVPDIKAVDGLTYADLLWKSKFIQIPVFQKQRICFSDAQKSDSILRFAKGTVIVKKVKIPKINPGDKMFVQVTEQSKGDAYDRTGSVFMIPTDQYLNFLEGMKNGVQTLPYYSNGNGKNYQGVVRTDQFTPLLELMRFFTPFGVHQYNGIKIKDKIWQDSVMYRQEITELTPQMSDKEVYVGAFIGNYDGNGHEVTVQLTLHPSGDHTEFQMKNVMPLFNTTNVMEMGDPQQEYGTMFNVDKGLEVSFEMPHDASNVILRYITTGHGGWGGGDEFVPKTNSIFVDDQLKFQFTPWRTDCGSYRLSNPASGNFADGLSSSDLSRSNWCPGTVTYPVYIDLGALKSGNHRIRIHIPQGENEGTSFSSWSVSGALLFE